MKTRVSVQERLKDLRVERGLKLEELAEQTGISKSALGSYENDDYKEINHGSLLKLADFYQVSVDYLKSGGQTEDENLKRFISLGSAMTNADTRNTSTGIQPEAPSPTSPNTYPKNAEIMPRKRAFMKISPHFLSFCRMCINPRCIFLPVISGKNMDTSMPHVITNATVT